MPKTYDYGIDLGTTNSSIAKVLPYGIEVFRNNSNNTITPSVVYIDAQGRIDVGTRAVHRPDAIKKFKLFMGKETKYLFGKANKSYTPEELSAEVLKSLVWDAQKATHEEITSAVICVPAAFDLSACDATHKAARLAGIDNVILLKEPVAAAIAYGHLKRSDKKVYWLTYDLGGGTFDAAIVSPSPDEGTIRVVDHKGDNHLGGSFFDDEIIDKVIIPQLKKRFALEDMRRDNNRYKSAFAKLEGRAEADKITLSEKQSVDIEIEELCHDNHQDKVHDVVITLSRTEYNQLILPYVNRTISMCKELLKRNHLVAGDIEKVLCVGGPLYTPLLLEKLRQELGIELDTSIDPLTVVARGAAIFAASIEVPDDGRIHIKPPRDLNAYVSTLHYEKITMELEPLVCGKVLDARTEGPAKGFSIKILRADKGWESPLVPIEQDGTFETRVRLEEYKVNEFILELYDSKGKIVKVIVP